MPLGKLEAWCRNPLCKLHGLAVEEPDLVRCESCGQFLAIQAIRMTGRSSPRVAARASSAALHPHALAPMTRLGAEA